jgi:hypothetical protein
VRQQRPAFRALTPPIPKTAPWDASGSAVPFEVVLSKVFAGTFAHETTTQGFFVGFPRKISEQTLFLL